MLKSWHRARTAARDLAKLFLHFRAGTKHARILHVGKYLYLDNGQEHSQGAKLDQVTVRHTGNISEPRSTPGKLRRPAIIRLKLRRSTHDVDQAVTDRKEKNVIGV